jgi:NADH-quinone oxidoreductase subunit G
VSESPFVLPIANFYMTDPISRASRTMAECVASRQQQLMAAE